MVKLGFYVWPLVSVLLVAYLLNQSQNRIKLLRKFGIFLGIWLAYIIFLSSSSFMLDYSIPPKVPLLVIVPVVALIIYFTGTKNFQSLYEEIPRHVPVYLQSFRIIVELLIYAAYLEGSFSKLSTFEGLNFDILVGISALFMGLLVQKKMAGKAWLMGWNILSLLVLTLTAYSFISTYYFSDYVEKGGSVDFVKLPYFFLAAVLLPVAIFFHIFSIRQLNHKPKHLEELH